MNPKSESNLDYENFVYKSRDGYFFSANCRSWKLNKNVTVRVGTALDLLSDEYKKGFLKTLLYYAQNMSAGSCLMVCCNTLDMIRVCKSNDLDSNTIINYRTTLNAHNEWKLGVVRTFLRRWNELGHDGISNELIDFIYSFKVRGSVKGEVVKRLDTLKGPFTDIELQGLNEAIIQAYETETIGIEDVALVLVASACGRRPIQISQLKVKDILIGQNKKAEPFWLINFPRAKQRGALFREYFSQFAITEDLYVILNAQINNLKTKLEKKLSFRLSDDLISELPIFPDYSAFKNSFTSDDMLGLLKSDRLHIKSSEVTKLLKKSSQVVDIQSERTAEPLNVNAYRFRYSLGTRAAREGLGIMAIADLLDHSDNQNASIYIQNIPEHAAKIDEAVGFQMAPIAQAFAGVLIDTEKDAIRGNDLKSRIRIKGDGIGTCGSFGFCGANVPIPCYTCIHFQPWLDGPHEIVYQELIEDRDRIIKQTGDIQIAAVNDRSILAVANVIQLCKLRREEIENGTNI